MQIVISLDIQDSSTDSAMESIEHSAVAKESLDSFTDALQCCNVNEVNSLSVDEEPMDVDNIPTDREAPLSDMKTGKTQSEDILIENNENSTSSSETNECPTVGISINVKNGSCNNEEPIIPNGIYKCDDIARTAEEENTETLSEVADVSRTVENVQPSSECDVSNVNNSIATLEEPMEVESEDKNIDDCRAVLENITEDKIHESEDDVDMKNVPEESEVKLVAEASVSEEVNDDINDAKQCSKAQEHKTEFDSEHIDTSVREVCEPPVDEDKANVNLENDPKPSENNDTPRSESVDTTEKSTVGLEVESDDNLKSDTLGLECKSIPDVFEPIDPMNTTEDLEKELQASNDLDSKEYNAETEVSNSTEDENILKEDCSDASSIDIQTEEYLLKGDVASIDVNSEELLLKRDSENVTLSSSGGNDESEQVKCHSDDLLSEEAATDDSKQILQHTENDTKVQKNDIGKPASAEISKDISITDKHDNEIELAVNESLSLSVTEKIEADVVNIPSDVLGDVSKDIPENVDISTKSDMLSDVPGDASKDISENVDTFTKSNMLSDVTGDESKDILENVDTSTKSDMLSDVPGDASKDISENVDTFTKSNMLSDVTGDESKDIPENVDTSTKSDMLSDVPGDVSKDISENVDTSTKSARENLNIPNCTTSENLTTSTSVDKKQDVELNKQIESPLKDKDDDMNESELDSVDKTTSDISITEVDEKSKSDDSNEKIKPQKLKVNQESIIDMEVDENVAEVIEKCEVDVKNALVISDEEDNKVICEENNDKKSLDKKDNITEDKIESMVLSDDDDETVKIDIPMEVQDSKIPEVVDASDKLAHQNELKSRKETSKSEVGESDKSSNVCLSVDDDDDDDIVLIDDSSSKQTDVTKATEADVPTTTKTSPVKDNATQADIVAETGESTKIPAKPPPERTDPPVCPLKIMAKLKPQLSSMSREDLEEFIVVKIVESISGRSLLSDLQLKVKSLEKGMDEWKRKVMSLNKQNKDLTIVLRNVSEEQTKHLKENPLPIKITRSVGLQVGFPSLKTPAPVPGIVTANIPKIIDNTAKVMTKPTITKAGIPVVIPVVQQHSVLNQGLSAASAPLQPARRSSRGRISLNASPVQSPTIPVSAPQFIQTTSPISTHLPVLPGPPPSRGRKLTNSPAIIPKLVPAAPVPVVAKNASIIATRPPIRNQTPSEPIRLAEKRPAYQSIDLTDDEPPPKIPTIKTPPRPNIRPVNTSQLTNHNKLAFVVNGSPNSSARQVYIPINAQGQNVQSNTVMVRGKFLSKVAIPGIRTPPPSLRIGQPIPIRPAGLQHPAPLPQSINPKSQLQNNWKWIPPRPTLKIARVENGIVISWEMDDFSDSQHEPIASYQIFAYQEATSQPTTDLWKKIGDVKALPLPMACTLTHFMTGFKYYFAVRAIDVRSRVGPFSAPGSITLVNNKK